MDDAQLRDEAVRDRVRNAQEFLDPRTPPPPFFSGEDDADCAQLILRYGAIDQILS
jgi:hypothetical protein